MNILQGHLAKAYIDLGVPGAPDFQVLIGLTDYELRMEHGSEEIVLRNDVQEAGPPLRHLISTTDKVSFSSPGVVLAGVAEQKMRQIAMTPDQDHHARLAVGFPGLFVLVGRFFIASSGIGAPVEGVCTTNIQAENDGEITVYGADYFDPVGDDGLVPTIRQILQSIDT